MPARVNVPDPDIVSEPPTPPLDPPSWITPEKVVLELLVPKVRLFTPRKTFPSPSTEPNERLGVVSPLMSSFPLPKSSTRAVPPVEFPENRIPPPEPVPVPPLAISVALFAVDVPRNSVRPPAAPLTAPPLFVNVPLLALDPELN